MRPFGGRAKIHAPQEGNGIKNIERPTGLKLKEKPLYLTQ